MPHPAKLVFFGTDAFSDTSLRALIAAGYDIAMVVTKPDAPVGRKRVMTPPAIKLTAEQHGIPVLQPTRASEFVDSLQGYQAGIVVSYGKILPQAVLDRFPLGLINVHASLLPRYRGASPIESALLNGDATTGVTLMKLDAGMDTGPTYVQATYDIGPTDTAATLYPKLASIGADVLINHLDAILDETLQPTPQDDNAATHAGMISKADGIIDWNKSATDISNQIRAYIIWPGSRTTMDGTEVTITAATVMPDEIIEAPGHAFRTEAGNLGMTCGDNTALIIDRLVPAGKREMAGREFLAGHPLN